MKKRKVGILLYDFVDVLDFAGPAEILPLATYNVVEHFNTITKKNTLPSELFEITTLTETGMPIKTHSGIKIEPDFSIANSPKLDILIIPGGPLKVVQSVARNQKIKEWINKHKDSEYICAVCYGTFILGETGILNEKLATTHHLALNILKEKYPKVKVVSGSTVVHENNLITTGGVSSGINMALYLVEQMMGKMTADRIAKTIEFVSL